MQKKLLNLIEKFSLYLKIDLKYILKGGSWLLSAQVFSTFCSFGLVYFLTNYLSKEDYGEYKYIITLFGIVGTIGLSGYGPSIASSVARGKDLIYKKASSKIFWYSLPASLLSILTAFYYLYSGNQNLFLGLLMIGLVNPLTNAWSVYTSFLSGKKDFKSITLFGAIPDILTFVFTALSILFTKNAVYLASIFLTINLFATAVAYLLTEKKYLQNSLPDGVSEKHALHNSVMYIFGNIVQNIDKVFVFHYLGAAELAIYSIVTQIPDQMKGIFKTVPDLVMAKFASQENLSKLNIWRKMFYMFVLVFIMILIYIVLSPTFFQIFFPKYIDYVHLSQIYSLSLIAVISFFPLTLLQAKQKTKELYFISTYTNVFQLIFVFIGVYFWGLMGIIIARILTRIFGTFIYIFYLNKTLK